MLPSREATALEIEETGLIHRVYHPAEHGEGASGPRPIVFLVHGRSGNASVMWFFAKAFATGAPILVSPQAPDLDPEQGFSWWDMTRGAGDSRSTQEKFVDASNVAERLLGFIDAATRLYGADRSRMSAAGFSQGSGVISTLSLLSPQLFQGVAFLSGFIPKAVMESPEELPPSQGARSRYLIVHGTKDDIIPIQRAEETFEWLRLRGLRVQKHYDEVTHKVGTQGLKTLTSWYSELAENI